MGKDDYVLPIDKLFDLDKDGRLDSFEKAIETGVVMDEFDEDIEGLDEFDEDFDYADYDDEDDEEYEDYDEDDGDFFDDIF